MMKTKVLALFTLILISIFPAIAQNTMKDIAFGGYSFSYPDTLGPHITITLYAGDPLDEPPPSDMMGWEARHTQFELYNEPASHLELSMRLAQIADLAGYPVEEKTLGELQDLLRNRPDLKTFEVGERGGLTNLLPRLPGGGASQILIARAEYIETDTLVGIRYLTVYVQDTYPLSSEAFRYVFIGMSKDESTYVWMRTEMHTDLFPAFKHIDSHKPSQEFYTDIDAYFQHSIEILNAAPASAFTPNLDELDSLLASIGINEGGE